MGDSNIEWTEKTWNPVRGCTRVSPGCKLCYAERQAIRHAGEGKPYEGLVQITNGHPQWTGKIWLAPIADDAEDSTLYAPFRWRNPARIFVNSMSDLFHEGVPFWFIDQVFGVMAANARHTFQILTKRPERMLEYMNSFRDHEHAVERLGSCQGDPKEIGYARPFNEETDCYIANAINDMCGPEHSVGWPLRNVWLGTSIEDPPRLEERMQYLLMTQAAVHWVSLEPLLAHLDLTRIPHKHPLSSGGDFYNALTGKTYGGASGKMSGFFGNKVEWVVTGGESGPGARGCDIAWIESIVKQCHAAGIPCFVKQIGAKPFDSSPIAVSDRKGGDPSEWTEAIRIREYPKAVQA